MKELLLEDTDEKPSTGLSEQLAKYDFKIGRLKTGTPPRLDARTINFENLEEQFADDDPYFFILNKKKFEQTSVLPNDIHK